MTELTTVARPYAEAVFRLAKETGSLAGWSQALANLALIASNREAQTVFSSPGFTVAQMKTLLLDLLGKDVAPEVANFVEIVLENRRFMAIPSIAEQFEALKAENDGEVEAHIESAFALSDAQLVELTAVLSQQFSRKVNAAVEVNPDLIGGVKVTVGDLVVDASVRGKLAQLAASLKS